MSQASKQSNLSWWQLSFIGVGCIIGTGYFLGSSIAIQKAGFAVLIAYLLSGIGTWIVYEALAKMTANHPEKGSFRTYAKHAYGQWAGFSNGWMYWSAEMLIMGSQLTAIAIFAQFWLPNIPIWIFAAVFAILGLLIILLGVQKVEQMENMFGIMKLSAIIMFIIVACFILFSNQSESVFQSSTQLSLPHGGIGLWVALLYAFYSFGGIEVMGLMAQELKDPKDAPKAGKFMIIALTLLYLLSIYLILKLTPISAINIDESPLLTTLGHFNITWLIHFFNGMLIIAGFSTMVASLYGVTTMLVTLADEGDAPKFFARRGKLKVPLPAFILTSTIVAVSIVIALLLPDKIFEYITTAAGLMLLYTWMFILFSFSKLLIKSVYDRIKVIFAFILILAAVSGTLFDQISRIGFFVSIVFLIIIAVTTWIKQRKGIN
ncbi:amino acid permease [Bacillus solimangrovi]|uniref:Transporter n=1 Tax=Bacillus solimangrovi TaxID=1305675 RepID=A0A1E5LK56_9BACI|nr:amino acid permease [Bacillus solimangrovi]OEH94451.1 transporter [Bacillus solimangrovi]